MKTVFIVVLVALLLPVVAGSWMISAAAGGAVMPLFAAAVYTAVVMFSVIRYLAGRDVRRGDA